MTSYPPPTAPHDQRDPHAATYSAPGDITGDPAEPGLHPTPNRKRRIRTAVVGALVAVGLLAGGGYAVAQATGGSATSSTSSAAGPAGSAPGGTAGGSGAMAGGPPQGTVVSTTDTTITVELTDGTTTTYTLGDGATVMDDGSTSTLSALTVGETVVVLTGQPGSTSTTATEILAGSSATSGPAAGGAGGAAPGAAASTAPASSTTSM